MKEITFTIAIGAKCIVAGIVAPFLCLLLIPASASAQTVFSAGIQEVYDSNVFLEDKVDELPPLPPPPPGEEPLEYPKGANGDPDDDLITNLFLDVSSAPRITRYANTTLSGRVGTLIFADQTDESRVTLDTLAELRTSDFLLREPYFASISSRFSSGSSDIATAEGTASRRAQTHTASLSGGVSGYDLSARDSVSAVYTLSRQDFLGEFLFNDRDEADEEALDVEGSDYLSNNIALSYTRKISQNLDGTAGIGIGYIDYTSVDSNDLGEKEDAELDRVNYSPYVGVSYLYSETVVLSGRVGADVSTLADDPDPRVEFITNPDGTTTQISRQPDDTQSTFAYQAAIDYFLPNWNAAAHANANQGAGSDIDGDRIAFRSFGVSYSQAVTDKWDAVVSGRYLQFSNDDSLSDSTERYEGTTAIKYSLSEAIALALGYNYVNQNRSDSAESSFFFRDGDYESHRVFVTLSGGLVGVSS